MDHQNKMSTFGVGRPAIPHQDSATSISTSGSFQDLFTRPQPVAPSSLRSERDSGSQAQSNRIIPVSDFPSQATRRPSSLHAPDDDEPSSPVARSHSRSSSGPSSASGTGGGTVNGSPRRSTSIRRKPVPSIYTVTPNEGLPADHPFATAQLAPSLLPHPSSASSSKTRLSSSSASARSVSVSAAPSPSMVATGAPQRQLGRTPPPPKRSVSTSRLVGPNIPPRAASRLLPSQLRTSDHSAQEGEQDAVADLGNALKKLDQNRIDPEDAVQARSISLSLDRPLPYLPIASGSGKGKEKAYITPRHSRPSSPVQPVTPQAHSRPHLHEPSFLLNSNHDRRSSLEQFEAANVNATNRAKTSSRPFGLAQTSKTSHPATSVPMGGTASGSGTGSGSGPGSRTRNSRSRIFRWDSTEKSKKAEIVKSESTSEEEEEFSVDKLPSKRNLWEAGTCFLKDEEGNLVCFGDLFPRWDGQPPSSVVQTTEVTGSAPSMEKATSYGAPPTATQRALDDTNPSQGQPEPVLKTIIFFIRHFWCGQCQDYTFASLSLLDPVALRKAGMRVVVISNGSWKIIKSYRKLFNCPFPIYVDGPRRLYQLMGMTKMTNDFGPMFKGRAAYHQRPVPTQLLHGLGNAFFRMPLANPGTLTQLGGEFILTPGWNCEFAHRMTNTSDHMEAPDVLRRAGCEFPTRAEVAEVELADSQREELDRLEAEMTEWREGRTAELERIRQKRAARRGMPHAPSGHESQVASGLNAEHGPEDFFSSSPEDDHASRGRQAIEELKADGEQLDASQNQVDDRYLEVLRDHERRAKERLAAGGLMLARGKGNLLVEVERKA